jgi:hypothetical protein
MLLCRVNGYCGESVMGSLKSQTRWEPINYYRIVRSKGKKGFIDV